MATLTFFTVDIATGACTSGSCSGVGSGSFARIANVSGPVAATSHSVSSSGTEDRYHTAIPGVAAWAGGAYDVTVAVTSANMNLTLQSIFLCRANSSCANQATVGSLTGINRSLGSIGSVTHQVTGSAQGSASATDKLNVILVLANSAMSLQAATLEVTIATPIEEAAGTPVELAGVIRA